VASYDSNLEKKSRGSFWPKITQSILLDTLTPITRDKHLTHPKVVIRNVNQMKLVLNSTIDVCVF